MSRTFDVLERIQQDRDLFQRASDRQSNAIWDWRAQVLSS